MSIRIVTANLIAGDFNRRPAAVAKMLRAGDHVEHKVDGVIVSPGMVIHGATPDAWGVRNRVTDHPALIVTVSLAGAR